MPNNTIMSSSFLMDNSAKLDLKIEGMARIKH